MDQQRLRELENMCIQECAPPCTALCPVHVDIRQLSLAVAQGDYDGGLKFLRKAVPFPEIIARCCDQPCQLKCNRETLGGVIQVASLELACVEYAAESRAKFTILPRKNARIAIVGGGLSGATAAFELSKKGYEVTLFEKENHLGGQLWGYPPDKLSQDVLEREFQIILQAKVAICPGEEVFPGAEFYDRYDAVYLGIGTANGSLVGLEADPTGRIKIDPATFQSSRANVFCGGSMLHSPSPILSISDGRRAAISIDRFLQNVSLTASRVNEGAYETRLYTNLAKLQSVEKILPEDPLAGYSKMEAGQEAARCLQCDCMECVKVCEFLKHYEGYPRKYVREIYNNLSIIMHAHLSNKFINSCTLCGLCGEVCPTDLNMGTVIRETRQTMVQAKKMPISAHEFALRDMAFSNSEKAAITLAPSEGCEYLFFPGCQLTGSNPDYIPRIYQSLANALPKVGVMLRCCGAPADWSGETSCLQVAFA